MARTRHGRAVTRRGGGRSRVEARGGGGAAARPRVTIARAHVSQIAIRASSGRIFGGFASEMRSPTPPEKFYGSGESFLFRIDGKLR